MLESMTGFGISCGEAGGYKFRVEAKSLNHRFFELKLKLPPMLQGLEPKLEELVKKYLYRGRVEIVVEISEQPHQLELSFDRSKAKAYIELFRKMQNELGLSGELDLKLLLSQEGIIISDFSEWRERHFEKLKEIFENCLSELKRSRKEEGHRLEEDINERLNALERLTLEIEACSKEHEKQIKENLIKKIKELAPKEIELNPSRLEEEVAYFVLKADINEEIVRLKSHIKGFKEDMKKELSPGKKLGFWLMEVSREINTIGAKALCAELSRLVVSAKTEIEKMREQLQNIE